MKASAREDFQREAERLIAKWWEDGKIPSVSVEADREVTRVLVAALVDLHDTIIDKLVEMAMASFVHSMQKKDS